jgi:hypothetical protein
MLLFTSQGPQSLSNPSDVHAYVKNYAWENMLSVRSSRRNISGATASFDDVYLSMLLPNNMFLRRQATVLMYLSLNLYISGYASKALGTIINR